MSNWHQVPLAELVHPDTPITYGVVQPGQSDPTGVLFVRSGDLQGGRILVNQLRTITPAISAKYSRTILRGGEVLVSLVGNPGAVAMVPQVLAGSNIARQVALLRFGDQVDAKFVKCYLQSFIGQRALGVEVLGSVQQVINLKELRKVRVPVPPLMEQRAIAQILGALDDKVDLNNELSAILDRMAQALFKSWFVDFDPVTAKAIGQLPFTMDAKTWALFPGTLVDSEAGPIPASWGLGTLGDVVEINPRSITETYPHRVIEYIDISSVSAGRLKSRTSCDLVKAPSRARRLVQDGDTIWSCVRPNRRSYLYIDDPSQNQVVSTGFAVLSPRGVPPSFLYEFVTADSFVDYLTANAEGSAYPAVRPEVFARAEVILPPKALLECFEGFVRPWLKCVAQNERESLALTLLRDALLPELLSGRLRVAGAERLVEQVV